MVASSGDVPSQALGRAVVHEPEENCIYIAYGRTKDDAFLSDFWKFCIDSQKWEKLQVNNVTPRAACGYALVDERLWFFGGITPSSYVSDLHYVDLKTLEVEYPLTTGPSPPPCALPLVAYFAPYLIVWAGTNGGPLTSLHILNTEDMEWKKISTEIVGRQGACGAIIDSTLYIFGASSPFTILTLDLNTFEFTVVPVTGVEPPHKMDCLTAVVSGDQFLLFETNGVHNQTKVYVFDTTTSNWMSYSASVTKPSSDLDGCDPCIVFYLPDERKLIALCDENSDTANPIAELSIGQSIATLNLRLDLLAALECK